MNIVQGHTGWLEVICGPMFSGKSEELMRRMRRSEIARRRVQMFQPAVDLRRSSEEGVSQGGLRTPPLLVSSAKEILDFLEVRTEVVGIDDAHFLGPDLVEIANHLADMGKQVIVAGLDTDYMGRPFEPIPALLALAEEITKTLAICVQCGGPAKYTQRLVESTERIVIGAAGLYEARCRRCFEPGVPRQQQLDFVKPKPGKVQ
ncbi:MAG: thymidine kinase [Acidobacteria bacterium]|nr:thymidine kinase [Acidobacteriota bacterium]